MNNKDSIWSKIDFREIKATLLEFGIFKVLYSIVVGSFSFPCTRGASNAGISKEMKLVLVATIVIDLLIFSLGTFTAFLCFIIGFFLSIYIIVRQLKTKKITKKDIEHKLNF